MPVQKVPLNTIENGLSLAVRATNEEWEAGTSETLVPSVKQVKDYVEFPELETAPVDTADETGATTEFVINQAGDDNPLINGTAAAGTSKRYARMDHVHPTDTTRAPLDGPTFTGDVIVPTLALGDSSTKAINGAALQAELADFAETSSEVLAAMQELAEELAENDGAIDGLLTQIGTKAPLVAPEFSTSLRLGGALQTTQYNGTNVTPNMQVMASGAGASIGFNRFDNTGSPARMFFGKSRGAAVGVHGAIEAGDELGAFAFAGSDGTAFRDAAHMRVVATGVQSNNRTPARIIFDTTDGSASIAARLSIEPDGSIAMGSAFTPVIDKDRLFRLRSYTRAGLPAAGTVGRLAYVSNVRGGTPAFDNGTSWRELIGPLIAVTDLEFGAVGNGVTDDTAAITAAVAAAYAASRWLYWPSGQYLTTASIPNLHSVKHFGPGAVKRGARTFYVDPQPTQTNTIFVDATAADDTLDGIDPGNAVKTTGRIPNLLSNYGPTLRSTWLVQLAAGNYGAINLTRKFITTAPEGLVRIYGPTVTIGNGASVRMLLGGTFGSATVGETLTGGTSSFNATVVSVLDGSVVATLNSGTPVLGETVTGGTSGLAGKLLWVGARPTAVLKQSLSGGIDSGITVQWNQQIDLRYLMTQDFTAAGVTGRKFVDIRFDHVYDEGSNDGVNVQSFVDYTMDDCCFVDNTNGIVELFQIHRNIQGDTSVIHGSTDSGFNSKESTVGHMDNLYVDKAGEAGLEFHSLTTANIGDIRLTRCGVGITGTFGEIHAENDVDWGTDTEACTRKYVRGDKFLLLTRSGWSGNSLTYRPVALPVNRYSNFTTNTLTGAQTLTVTLGELYANEHATKGQRIVVKVKGKREVGSNDTLVGRLKMEGNIISTSQLPATAMLNSTFTFVFEIVCYADGDFQRCYVTGREEGPSNTLLGEDQTQDFTETWVANDKTLVLEVIQTHASDSAFVNEITFDA